MGDFINKRAFLVVILAEYAGARLLLPKQPDEGASTEERCAFVRLPKGWSQCAPGHQLREEECRHVGKCEGGGSKTIQTFVAGSFDSVPPGCSVQRGGAEDIYFNRDRNGENDGSYDPVCTVYQWTQAPICGKFKAEEPGYCVTVTGADQNSNVVKLYTDDVETAKDKEKCLGLCGNYNWGIGVTGCEAVWDQWNRGCYVHTSPVDHGNGVANHACWIRDYYYC